MWEASGVAEETLDFWQRSNDGAILVPRGKIGAEADEDVEDEDRQIRLIQRGLRRRYQSPFQLGNGH